jgi:tRNA 2-thiouridine synthesizing protein A
MTHVDARGLRCPWPALRAAKAMRSGAAFIIAADDPRAEAELAALARARGWAMDAVEDEAGPGWALTPP